MNRVPPIGSATWLLRECVRANPLYVLSACLFGWGVLELSRSIDAQVWDTPRVCTVAALIHVYELCLLAVATVVLFKRCEGGRDMHGLLIVAALFLSGGLIALDEMINLWPGYAPAWIAGALALAFIKLEWYGRLPGLHLPPRYRRTALGILAAHCVPALLASQPLAPYFSKARQAELGWLAGWASLAGVFVLLTFELRRDYAKLKDFSVWKLTEAEVVRSHVPGVWLIALTALLGLTHAFVTDWIFDRPMQAHWALPALALGAAIWFLARFTFRPEWSAFNVALAVAPTAATMWAWSGLRAWQNEFEVETWLGLGFQLAAAAALAYLGLAWATRRKVFLLALVGYAVAPLYLPLKVLLEWLSRSTILISSGFLTLFGGMLLSLCRERLLRRLTPVATSPAPVPPVEPPPGPTGQPGEAS